jgi:eukaryotic-like serine/threonine-protein kinase
MSSPNRTITAHGIASRYRRRMRPGDEPTRRIGPPATRRLPPVDGPDEVLGGRYRLEGVIGAGRTAEVHRATDLQLGRPVAVKVFRGDDPRTEDGIRALAGLRHPGLVAVHDSGTDRGRAYLVTELVDGPTLRQELARGPFDAAEVTRIGAELARVLATVHAHGVVHGHLTPSNVLLEQDGRVRLTDAGLGEPAREGQPADVYALGLVLLEALTGHPAVERRPPAVPAGTPSPLRDVLHATTVTDPAQRPTAREVAGMLAAPAAEPASLGNGRRGALVAIGVAVLLAVLIGVVFAAASSRDAPVAAPTSAPAAAPTTSAAPRTSAPRPDLPSIPDLPTALPDLPTALPDLPTALPTVPPDVQENAKSLWDSIREWWASLF